MIKLDCYAIHADELEHVDAIAVNGVYFVPQARHDGTKALLCDYLEDARAMVRERDDLIADLCDLVDSIPPSLESRIAELNRLDE